MDAAELKDDDLHEKRMARLARERAELSRLRAIETAARALKFSAYPAHGSGFVIIVTGGNINDLESALNQQSTKPKEFCHICGMGLSDVDTVPCGNENCPLLQQ